MIPPNDALPGRAEGQAPPMPCAVLSSCLAVPVPWSGMRILLQTLAANELVWKETPITLRPLLSGLFQKWCDYLTLHSSRPDRFPGASAAANLSSILNTIADTIAGITSQTGLTLIIPDIHSIDAETIWLLEPLLSRLGSKLRLVVGCDLTGRNGVGEEATRRILRTISGIPGAFVTFTVDPDMGHRLWFNAEPDEVIELTESYKLETAA